MTVYVFMIKQYLFNEMTMSDDIEIEQRIEIIAENIEEANEMLYDDYYYESAELIGCIPFKN